MTNSPRHRWQLRWRADTGARCCAHDSGLIFDWAPGSTAGAFAHCVGPDGAAWAGTIRGGSDAARAWLAAQLSIRDDQSKRTRMQRITREAGEIFAAALKAGP